MFYSKIHEQTILEISQGDYISATADSFLIDRQAGELSRHTLRFYREFLRTLIDYCSANSLRFIQEVTPDFLRCYFPAFGEKHNPGAVQGGLQDSTCILPMACSNIWLQNISFLLLTTPNITGIVLAAMLFAAIGLSTIFERRAFCRSICPVGGFIGLYSPAAPIELTINQRQ